MWLYAATEGKDVGESIDEEKDECLWGPDLQDGRKSQKSHCLVSKLKKNSKSFKNALNSNSWPKPQLKLQKLLIPSPL